MAAHLDDLLEQMEQLQEEYDYCCRELAFFNQEVENWNFDTDDPDEIATQRARRKAKIEFISGEIDKVLEAIDQARIIANLK